MPKEYVRLALVQMLIIFLSIVITGLVLKGRFIQLPAYSFPVLIRNHGFLLLIAPAVWAIWALLRTSRPTFDTRDQAKLMVTGMAMCLFFLVLGALSVRAAFGSRGMVIMHHPSEAEPERRSR